MVNRNLSNIEFVHCTIIADTLYCVGFGEKFSYRESDGRWVLRKPKLILGGTSTKSGYDVTNFSFCSII